MVIKAVLGVVFVAAVFTGLNFVSHLLAVQDKLDGASSRTLGCNEPGRTAAAAVCEQLKATGS